jgi:hypothetical protein
MHHLIRPGLALVVLLSACEQGTPLTPLESPVLARSAAANGKSCKVNPKGKLVGNCDKKREEPSNSLPPSADQPETHHLDDLGSGPPDTTSAAGQPRPRAEEQARVVPASIDTTGARDVTTQLAQFIASSPDGSTIVFRKGARYRLDGTLRIVERNDLTFDGAGALFFTDVAAPAEHRLGSSSYPWRGRSQWSIEGGSGITLRNMVIRGANSKGGREDLAYRPAYEAQHAVNIAGAERVLVEDLTISHTYGDFVYIGGRTTRSGRLISREIVVRGGSFSHNGRQGIAITNADGVLVEGIRMTETRRASIDLEPNTASAIIRNITVRDSYFGPGRLLWLAAGGQGATMENVTLENNRLDRTMTVYIKTPAGTRRSNVQILSNTSTVAYGSVVALMRFLNTDGIVVRGNHAPLTPRREMTAVYISNSTQYIVENNTWPGALRGLEIVD